MMLWCYDHTAYVLGNWTNTKWNDEQCQQCYDETNNIIHIDKQLHTKKIRMKTMIEYWLIRCFTFGVCCFFCSCLMRVWYCVNIFHCFFFVKKQQHFKLLGSIQKMSFKCIRMWITWIWRSNSHTVDIRADVTKTVTLKLVFRVNRSSLEFRLDWE